MQRTGKSYLQMFAFSFFGRHPYLQIFAYFASLHSPSESLLAPQNRHIHTDYQLFTFEDITFCIGKISFHCDHSGTTMPCFVPEDFLSVGSGTKTVDSVPQ